MKLTQQEKDRLAVCRDVLKWIKPSKVKTGNGYVINRSKIPTCEFLDEANSKKIAKALQKTCQVCAKGAMFLSLVGLKNMYDFDPAVENHSSNWLDDSQLGVDVDYDNLMGRLEDVFEEEQLHMVETAFEVTHGADPVDYGWGDNAPRKGSGSLWYEVQDPHHPSPKDYGEYDS